MIFYNAFDLLRLIFFVDERKLLREQNNFMQDSGNRSDQWLLSVRKSDRKCVKIVCFVCSAGEQSQKEAINPKFNGPAGT